MNVASASPTVDTRTPELQWSERPLATVRDEQGTHELYGTLVGGDYHAPGTAGSTDIGIDADEVYTVRDAPSDVSWLIDQELGGRPHAPQAFGVLEAAQGMKYIVPLGTLRTGETPGPGGYGIPWSAKDANAGVGELAPLVPELIGIVRGDGSYVAFRPPTIPDR